MREKSLSFSPARVCKRFSSHPAHFLMDLLTGLLALLLEYHEDEECDCGRSGTCRYCLTRVALAEAARTYPREFVAAEATWWRELEARFPPRRKRAAPPPREIPVEIVIPAAG